MFCFQNQVQGQIQYSIFLLFVLELDIELDIAFLYRAEKLLKGWDNFNFFQKKIVSYETYDYKSIKYYSVTRRKTLLILSMFLQK